MLVGQLATSDSEALLQLIKYRYKQVAEVNLSTKQCRIIWPDRLVDAEQFAIDELLDSDMLYESEAKVLRKLHNAEYVKSQLMKKNSISYKFRKRLSSKSVEWMQIEVVRGISYREDNIDVIVFLKNIEESYGNEYRARKAAEKLAETDPLTGYYNRLAYDTFCHSCHYDSIGVAYIDLNQLKVINDTEGHRAGDAYIRRCCSKISAAFANYNKYRIGGDEFVVIAPNSSRDDFYSAVMQFNMLIDDNECMPVCAIGQIWSLNDGTSLHALIRGAERKMYKRKEADYLKYNEDRRRGDRRHKF